MSAFHSPGPCHLTYAGGTMGYGLDGFEVEIVAHHRAVKYDVFGGADGPPADFQMMLGEAFISGTMEAFTWSVLYQAISNAFAGASLGQMPAAGTLLGANGFLKPLLVPSPTDDLPWLFPSSLLISPTRFHKGTITSQIPILFHCIPYGGNVPDSSAGLVLWQ